MMGGLPPEAADPAPCDMLKSFQAFNS